MTRTRIGIIVGLATLALAAAGCGGGDNESATGTTETTSTETSTSTSTETGTTLDGSVGPGFVISRKDADGQDVSTLTAGTYTINVDDQADIHNFHLTGPGVDEMTDVGGTGPTTWTVTFQDGSYHFQCDPHASTMNGDFEVSG
jgi:plastocyanin